MIRKELQKRLDDYQNDYMEIMRKIYLNKCDDLPVDKERGYIYWWERAKKLQMNIINLTFMEREIALEKAKEALEAAFTPHIKEMLDKKIQKEIDEEESV
ncbi:MAG: hypothetical protein EX285_04910 [Thaumarchaeota archaeon]|jgi:hypothetical protein|nr:hypothetical protein [Nitrososphaerota archaeon]